MGIVLSRLLCLVLPLGLVIWTSFQPINTQSAVAASCFALLLMLIKVVPSIHRAWGSEAMESDGWKVHSFRRSTAFVTYGPDWPWWRNDCLYKGAVSNESQVLYEFAMSISGPLFALIWPHIVYNTRLLGEETRSRKVTLVPFCEEVESPQIADQNPNPD